MKNGCKYLQIVQILTGTPCSILQQKPEHALFIGSKWIISHTLWLKCIMHVGEQISSYCKDTFPLTPIRMVIVGLKIYFNRFSKLELWMYMHMAITTFNTFEMFNLYIHVIYRCVVCICGQNSNLEKLFYMHV